MTLVRGSSAGGIRSRRPNQAPPRRTFLAASRSSWPASGRKSDGVRSSLGGGPVTAGGGGGGCRGRAFGRGQKNKGAGEASQAKVNRGETPQEDGLGTAAPVYAINSTKVAGTIPPATMTAGPPAPPGAGPASAGRGRGAGRI